MGTIRPTWNRGCRVAFIVGAPERIITTGPLRYTLSARASHMTDLRAFLESIHMQQYEETMRDLGCDDPNVFPHLMGDPKYIQALRGGLQDRKVPLAHVLQIVKAGEALLSSIAPPAPATPLIPLQSHPVCTAPTQNDSTAVAIIILSLPP